MRAINPSGAATYREITATAAIHILSLTQPPAHLSNRTHRPQPARHVPKQAPRQTLPTHLKSTKPTLCVAFSPIAHLLHYRRARSSHPHPPSHSHAALPTRHCISSTVASKHLRDVVAHFARSLLQIHYSHTHTQRTVGGW